MGLVMIALAIAIGIGMIALATRATKTNNRVIESLTAKLNLGAELKRFTPSVGTEYLGGHPSLPNPGRALVSFRERGFVIVAGGKAAANIYSVVRSVDFMNQEQISRDVTLTRMLTLGVFSLAAKKKRVTDESFCKFIISIKGIENAVLLKSKQAGQIASQLNAGRINVAK